MTSRHRSVTASLLAALAGCGNYSNEDVEFMLGVPDRDELVAKLPQALVVADAAEYYLLTRKVVRDFNGIVDAFLGLIDAVRSLPPSERLPGRRIWGPFAHEKRREWQVRVTIDRVGDPAAPERFEYAVSVRRVRTDVWLSLIKGHYALGSLGVRRGKGQMTFETEAVRAAGYLLDDLNGIFSFKIDHQRDVFPVSVKMQIIGFPKMELVDYSYLEDEDSSGSMTFDIPWAPPLADRLNVSARWNGSGAGRGDLLIVGGIASNKRGVDCWGIDTRATFTSREWENNKVTGDPGTCLLPGP